MGVWVHANLVYGWEVPAWNDRLTKPTGEPDEDGEWNDDDDGQEMESLTDDTPYLMTANGYCEYPKWVFGFRETYVKADYDDPAKRPSVPLKTPLQADIKMARAWAEENGIPLEGEPAWLLGSYSDH